MNKPLLSICISTFNRAEQLEKSLRSIVSQTPFQEKKVEIVICDNASTDATPLILKQYKELSENILIYRNEQYVDTKRFPYIISLGSGLLRKLSNDTIVYEDGALEDMCTLIEHFRDQKPVVFWSNGTLSCVPEGIIAFDTFVKVATFQVTWIGAVSIWDTDCDNIEKDTDGCEKLLWQVRKTYELASAKDKCVIINNKFGRTLSVDKKNISYGLYKVFYENFVSFLMPYLETGKISQNTFNSVERDLLYDFFTPWIIEWELNREKYRYNGKKDGKCGKNS